ncbi:MAG: CAP domain-containing protein, partial [Microbacterium sp.]
MAAHGSLSHNPSVGQQIPGGWSRWGENVAQGYGNGAAVHNGWMNSSGHRANILGGFTDVGVALIQAGGTTWAVQVFAAYAGSGLPAPAPPPPPPPPAPAPAPAAPAAPAPA